jgi:NADH-quinone oxidoreductase subunit L
VEASVTNTWIDICVLLTLLLPLASFILSLIITPRYSWLVSVTATFLLLLAVIASCYVFAFQFQQTTVYHLKINWFSINEFQFTAGLLLDRHSIVMLPVVTIISFLVHLYSIGYMAGDKSIGRYFAMLGFFTFSMIGIVTADNLLLIFVFWELVGFSSYLLIGHWTEKPAAAAAAKKAFIFNRIGDAGFLVGLMIIWANVGSFALAEILQQPTLASWQTVAALCLFCGVIGKSAQFPLLTWLPDAMEGPTPVSALIHAATMVAAGVFLLAKIFLLFTPFALEIVASVGAITSLMAALSALVQYDIKKILAYSTISQLGFMVLAIGVGADAAAMTHLISHAFFKAGLFLGAGAVIHSLHQLEQQTHQHFDVQDIRNLGGLKKHLPVTFLTFLLCGAALSGLPFFAGFLSKDAILTGVWAWERSGSSMQWIIVIIAFITPFLTAMYSFRLIWFVFFGESRLHKIIPEPFTITEVPAVMRLPLIILSLCSLWLMASLNPFDFSGWLYNSFQPGETFHFHFITVFSAAWVLTALVTSFFIFKSSKFTEKQNQAQSILKKTFYLDYLYKNAIGTPVKKLSTLMERTDIKIIDGALHFAAYAHVTVSHVTGWFDRFFVDGTVNGMARIARLTGSFARSFQGGKIQLYIFWAIFGIIIFLIWMLFEYAVASAR